MKTLTKQKFRDGMDSGQIDVRPTNEAYINGNKYKVKIYEYEDKVELEKA